MSQFIYSLSLTENLFLSLYLFEILYLISYDELL